MNETAAPLQFEAVRVVAGGRQILAVDRFEVGRGEVVALLGPNGAGKSTLLRTGALLLQPAGGVVRLFGREANGRAAQTRLRRRTASVFTDPTLLDMSARANVEIALAIRGVPRTDRSRQAEAWLDRLGVLRLAAARPHTLSAGEAQRVALARAFAVGPELLFLDEPFASLDIEARATLVGDLRELLASEGATAVIASHDHGEAALLADSVAVLLGGSLLQSGPAASVFTQPASPDVARVLGHSIVEREQLQRVAPLLIARGAVASIPPAAITLVALGTEGAIEARVLRVRSSGGRAQLVCDVGVSVLVDIDGEPRTRVLREGDRVYLRVDVDRVHWLP